METGDNTQTAPSQPEDQGHVLPAGSKMHRMSAHAQGLVEDMRTWAELRIKLAQMEIEEQVDQKVNALVRGAIMGIFASLAALFALVTLALLLGWLLGHPFWGFLIVTLLLAAVVIVVRKTEPRLVKIAKGFIRTGAENVSRGKSAGPNNE